MHSFLDIHTHREEADPDVRSIYNVHIDTAGMDVEMPPSDGGLSMGLHPWFLTEANKDMQFRLLAQHADDDVVKLIGECGFDRLRGPAMPLQRAVFEQQVQLALTCGKPVLIHCVRAFDELASFGKRYTHSIPMVIHGFNKSPEQAKQLTNQGFFLSFGAAILNEASGAAATLRKIDCPFFLETDDAIVDIRTVYEQAAFLRNVTQEVLKDTIFASWKTIQLI